MEITTMHPGSLETAPIVTERPVTDWRCDGCGKMREEPGDYCGVIEVSRVIPECAHGTFLRYCYGCVDNANDDAYRGADLLT